MLINLNTFQLNRVSSYGVKKLQSYSHRYLYAKYKRLAFTRNNNIRVTRFDKELRLSIKLEEIPLFFTSTNVSNDYKQVWVPLFSLFSKNLSIGNRRYSRIHRLMRRPAVGQRGVKFNVI